jgi:hypothetical protein
MGRKLLQVAFLRKRNRGKAAHVERQSECDEDLFHGNGEAETAKAPLSSSLELPAPALAPASGEYSRNRGRTCSVEMAVTTAATRAFVGPFHITGERCKNAAQRDRASGECDAA